MSDYLAIPPAKEVRGTVAAPASKSATNRALILAALSRTPVEIVGPLDSEDTRALAACLAAMGASVVSSSRGLRVGGPLFGPSDREVALDAKESGTAARFLTAIAAVVPGRFLLTGSRRLCERPQEELVAALRSAGAGIEYAGAKGYLPLRIAGGRLRSGSIAVDASRSSQFLSALLLAAPALEGGLEVVSSSEIVSAPYVATTLDCLRAFGHQVSIDRSSSAAAGVAIRPIRVVAGRSAVERYDVPGDYSSALPLLASCGATSGTVTVTGLTWPSSDADAGALPVLQEMGLAIEGRPGAVTARCRGDLRAVTVSASHFPDAVPALAALAALADGESRFEDIGHLRLKESDRIGSLAALIDAGGARAEAGETSLVVRGPARRRDGGAVRKLATLGDHRIAMAAGLLSLALPGFLVENPGCIAKSYPGFFRDLESLTVRP
jgi:3-phosphoshikimate 1-carboxyvinyltransferase